MIRRILLGLVAAFIVAVTKVGDTPAARRFLQFLSSPAAQEAFTRRGFITE